MFDDDIDADDFTGASKMPLAPTRATPGSENKCEVMMYRAARNQSLFHPFDCRYEGDTLPDKWFAMSESERAEALDSIKPETPVSVFFS
jgi:hypothetical protein